MEGLKNSGRIFKKKIAYKKSHTVWVKSFDLTLLNQFLINKYIL